MSDLSLSARVQEALSWLDRALDDLSAETYYSRDTRGLINRLETMICGLHDRELRAVRLALCSWLTGEDKGRLVVGLSLVERLKASECAPALRQLRSRLAGAAAQRERDWLTWVDQVLASIGEVASGPATDT